MLILDDFLGGVSSARAAAAAPGREPGCDIGPGRERRVVACGPLQCAPPRWRASARAAGGWCDLPAETLSTPCVCWERCGGVRVVTRMHTARARTV